LSITFLSSLIHLSFILIAPFDSSQQCFLKFGTFVSAFA